jgi:subtilisin family serine protease
MNAAISLRNMGRVLAGMLIVSSTCMHTAAAEKNGGLVGVQTDGDFVAETIPHGLRSAYVPREILVRFKPSAGATIIQSIHSRLNSTVLRRGGENIERVRIEEGRSVEQAVYDYLEEPEVDHAQPNFIYIPSALPNDGSFDQLWGLHNTGQVVNGTAGTADADVDAPEAWDIATGSSETIVAVIDSGLDFHHPDLAANIWQNPGETSCTDGIDDDGNGYVDDCVGWDFWANDNDPSDCNGHGTEVAGIIGAVGNNSTGVTGISWDSKIMVLRTAAASGYATTFTLVQAVNYAIAKNARVINCSTAGYHYDQLLYEAIQAAEGADVLFVTCAGNDGINIDIVPCYPASYDLPNIIAVAATDQNDNLATFSDFGSIAVDVAAPGVNIYGTIPFLGYGTPTTVYSRDFDADIAGSLPVGWSSGGVRNTWGVDNASAFSQPNSLEDSPGGNYANNTSSWVWCTTPISPVKDNRYTLNFRVRSNLEYLFDFLLLMGSPNQVDWVPTELRTGQTFGSFYADSASYTYAADIFPSFYFGFGFYSDPSFTFDGVYLDNIILTAEPIFIASHTYEYRDGTSFASPYVAGLAALIWSQRAGLTSAEVKGLIESNVDVLDSLRLEDGEYAVSSGGRINAYKALSAVLATLLPTPTGQESFAYPPAESPLKGREPSLARPIGVGPVAEGGDALRLCMCLDQCSGPVDVYFGFYAPSMAPDIFVLTSDYIFQPLSQGLVPWKTNLTGDLDETPFGEIPINIFPSGIYELYLLVTPTGYMDRYYFWQTSFTVP